MAKARAIVKRRKSVQNIRKITRTMELIATARFKKALDRATEAEAYTRKIAELVADLSTTARDVSHPLLEVHDPVRRSLLLVLTSNRGLAGGYNGNVLRVATRAYQDAQARTGERVPYEFIPDPRSILEEIVPVSFKVRLFKCFLDAAVSEQIARMVAMKGATENADEMVKNLTMLYNRARQAQITRELAEIIGGAAALE